MSRIEYGESEWGEGLWWGALKHSLNSKKGQAALGRLRDALLALPEKQLIADAISDGSNVCAIGALAAHELVVKEGWTWDQAMAVYDDGPDGDWATQSETIALAQKFGFSYTLAFTVVEQNDDMGIANIGGIFCRIDDELRYWDILGWIEKRLVGLDAPTPIPAAVMQRAIDDNLNRSNR
jgi:hypothetical protein